MPAIINSGAAYIAAKVAALQPVDIATFVLANVPGLDDTQPVNLAETLPAGGDIVLHGCSQPTRLRRARQGSLLVSHGHPCRRFYV